ncbi:UvrD-helicase domain-containing protein [Flavobacterium sp. J49]|uniref:UvrD-helicase domain-containing protein n=1 Tax=Flavobacterium sp. J49 TaxID=2718534 RepID=UPI00159414BC|nr:UvrD-helicase domain-containing protein [Flavobacterium sp. J49]MBF6641323.1 UvrD-helicase domain-containing protein [Flavobacterium sp. J49]NIC02570.1 UvrD-helicase domain-containing protein [Flavobacterium sp. J49]
MQKTAFSLYDASAGSGKTYTLVKEYLKIILLSKKPDAYRNILAITFTNKAVHEMKSRVVESLSEFAKENPSDKALQLMQDIQAETGLSLATITEKAKSIIKNLIHNYAAFDISTIDKFTHKVIRAFAHDLNLPITFEVSLDTENLLTEAVDAIIAEAGNDETLTNLLVDFTMEKTDDDKSWDISREIMDTGKLILNENNREEITHFQNKTITEFVEIKNKLTELCAQIETETIELATEALLLIEKNGIDIKSFSGGYFPKHLVNIQEKKFNPANKTYHEFDDIKINKTASDRAVIERIIPDLLEILASIYKKFEKKNFYEAFLKNITPLSLLNTVSNELGKIQKEQNILSIAEFNKLINEQIQNQPAPFIYERLGEKYRNFFIDEFQDTSEMQWQNLIPLIDNALSSEDLNGERGSLMIVGDPKQSIYRWRGGKAEQFIELSKDKNPFVNPDKKLFSLGTNWRSYSEIIYFNNKLFGFLSHEFAHEDYKDLYQNHSHQQFNAKTGGYVNISFVPKIDKETFDDEENVAKNELYLQATLATIEKVKQKGFRYKDIVILTRKKAHGTEVANYLTENGIPILSSESLLLGASSEVQGVIHILRYLKNSNDLLSKANFLYYLASQQNTLAIHDFIAQGMEQKTETEFQKWLTTFNIDFSFQNIRKKSLYEATEIIIAKVIPMDKRNAYIQFFLDLILEHDLKKQAGISDFLAYWDNNSEKLSIPSPEGNDAVRIMTIHKSKGLEFPVVIFPFAEEDYSKGPREKMWLNADEAITGLPKALVDKSSKVEGYGEEANVIYQQKKQEELLDNINVLYVALTRAEEQLYIISGMQSRSKTSGEYPNNMATFFIKFLANDFDESKFEYSFGEAQKLSETKDALDKTETIPQLAATLNPKNIKIAQKESLMWNTQQQKAIEFGNILHEILSFVKTKDDIDLALIKAIENGLIVSSQRDEVEQTIQQVVNHPDLIPFFAIGNKILNEKTIIQKEGNLVKPDRMVLNANQEIYLLDYKTGAHQTKYTAQLENYQNAIEKMGFTVTKKALVYIGESLEIVNL